MTAGMEVRPDTPGVPSWRAYGLALLPLALLGILPPWSCLALCLAYGVGVWSSRWAEVRLMFTLIVTALTMMSIAAGATRHGLGALVTLATSYIIWTAAGVALNWGAMQVEEGQRRGLIPVLVMGLLAPQPLLLLALAGGLLARPGPDDRRSDRVGQARMWPWIGAVVALSLLCAALLPRPVAAWLTHTPEAIQQTAAPGTRTDPTGEERDGTDPDSGALTKPFQLEVNTSRLATPLAALGVAAALLLLTLAVLIRPTLKGALRRRAMPGPIDLLIAVALVLTGGMWVVVAMLLNGGGQGDTSGHAAARGANQVLANWLDRLMNAPASRSVDLTRLLQSLLWVGSLLAIVLTVVAIMRLRGPDPEPATEPAPPEGTDGAASQPDAPLHRVRRAYREAEAALTDTGRGRGPDETPGAYARRLGAGEPPLASALTILSAAYEPVRYGGRVSEDDAEQAEAAVQTLLAVLPTLPRMEPGADAEPESRSLSSGPKESL
ncbi:DUF4129 domain-containing protein [Deinococcus navajonensis]|uniref:DUF4129 domain-containing protein n=1 Tax=Deinococcus navajonensis TaxID=309884 RepID=A0ABV8XNE2_9DEIO